MTKKQTTDDAVNQTALYFEKYQEGYTITQIADHFERSRPTIYKYLEKHPKYEPSGAGNKITKEQGRVLPKNTGKSINEDSSQLVFRCPDELYDRLNNLLPLETLKDKLIKAIEQYLDLKVSDRPKTKIKSKNSNSFHSSKIPNKLIDKLNQSYKSEKNQTRQDKITAAIELFLATNEQKIS